MPKKTLESLELELRDFSLTYPEVTEDHPWGHRAMKVKGKAFVFLGGDANEKELSMSVKLPQSRDMAADLPFAEPTGYGLGKSGWVTARFTKVGEVPLDLLKKWIDESYRAIAPKKLVKTLALLFVFLLAATVASARPLELPRANEKWITLGVDEFTFVSNVSAAETSEIARDVLRMRHAVGAITKMKVRAAKPTRIFIFGSERGFAPYRQTVLGQNSETIQGAFITADGGNFIVMKRDDADDVDRTVYHELTHYFVRNTAGSLPLWLSEGLAEYYSTFRTSGDAVYIGRPIAEHVQWLREQTLIPMRELLATTSNSPIYNEGERQGVFYAQSWALVHYLLVDDARRAQLGQFLRFLSEAKPVDEAFAAAFGKSYADMEVDLRAYVRKRAFTYSRYSLAALDIPELAKPEPMPRESLLFELGHLLVHAAPEAPDDARRFLDEVLTVNPSHAGVYADIGRMHHIAGRRQEADAAFARAVQFGSGDPQVHLLVGTSALEQFRGGRQPIAAPTEALLKARTAFARSAELDPNSALAWTGVGATYVFTTEDPAPGIAALEKSLALAPGDANAAFHLVQLYARTARVAEAKKLIETVLARGGSEDMLAFAREALHVATSNASIRKINEAIEKANSGQAAEAVAILDGVLPELDDAEMQSRAKELRAEIASRIKN